MVAEHKRFDAFPFGFLTLVVSLEAIILSVFVLLSQNRQVEKDKVRSDVEYDVNLKAELEIMHLHEKLDRLTGDTPTRLAAIEAGSSRLGWRSTRGGRCRRRRCGRGRGGRDAEILHQIGADLGFLVRRERRAAIDHLAEQGVPFLGRARLHGDRADLVASRAGGQDHRLGRILRQGAPVAGRLGEGRRRSTRSRERRRAQRKTDPRDHRQLHNRTAEQRAPDTGPPTPGPPTGNYQGRMVGAVGFEPTTRLIKQVSCLLQLTEAI